MKQMLPAAMLSIILHFAVLNLDTGWFGNKTIVPPMPRSVTVTMSYRPPMEKEIPKKPVEKKKKKKVPKPKSEIIPEKKEPLPEKTKEPEEADKAEDTLDEELESLTHGNNISNMQVVQDAVPHYKTNRPPRYPMAARRRGYQGIVELMVLVTGEGRVSNLWVYESSGYKLLDNAAVDAVKNWRFEPGTKNGALHEMWVKVPVRFELKKSY